MGDFTADDPTLVRVHIADTLRDLVGAKADHPKWTIDSAMAYIAAAGKGVLVLLDNNQHSNVLGSIEAFFAAEEQSRQYNTDAAGAYLTIGTGSQILRDLGVGKMRLLSQEIKFSAISGFDLGIVEYITCG
jgi:3,4-dihydroxy 2-butanone 4-phosphate synthase/GTP cyclohydrolase II